MATNNPQPTVRGSVLLAAPLVVLIWWLKVCEALFGWDLHQLGVYPRTASGLIGIVTAPLVHGSWQHLAGNTLPLLVLGGMLAYGYPRSRRSVVALIWLLSGAGVWLFARGSYHFGASGLAHGMFFFLFTSGILRRDKRSSALLMIAFYLYGGMLMTIFPREPEVSFESHLFGAVAGIFCAFVFRDRDPKPVRRPYSWELEADDEAEPGDDEDPVIGDQWKRD
jgi:membrane associated rhomboid family serine protease